MENYAMQEYKWKIYNTKGKLYNANEKLSNTFVEKIKYCNV
jgi:hypothetical protein